MAGNGGKVHVVRVTKTGYLDKQGRRKDYSSAYLRRTYRDGGKVKNETVANLSTLPDHVRDGGERGGVAGVAGKHPDRDRASLGVGEQPVLDLQFPFLAVAGVAAGGQRAARAFHP